MRVCNLVLPLALFAFTPGCRGCAPAPVGLPDAGPIPPIAPARVLVEQPLFGTLSVENRIFDPTFSLPLFAWSAFSLSYQELPLALGRWPDAPTRTPVLMIQPDQTLERFSVAGIGRGGAAPLFAQVWVASHPEASPPTVSVLGFDPLTGQIVSLAIPLVAEPTPFRDSRENIWRRFEGAIGQDLAGWVTLVVEADTAIEIAGPTLLQGSGPGELAARLPPTAQARPTDRRQRRLLHLMQEHFQRAQVPPAVMKVRRREAQGAQRRRMGRTIEQARQGR